MKREIYKQLLEWKLSVNRKPLILQGARQIGKTWILRHFGECEYKYVAYINCDNEPLAQSLFVDYNIERILLVVESITHVPIVAGETLIIFDEIQEIAKGLSALKYFCENAPEHHVAVAGSLLGLILHPGESFPVGKVDMLQMYPMTYEEFLVASGEEKLVDILHSQDWATISTLHSKYIDLLRRYYYVGGMPEAVKTYVEQKDYRAVRKVHNEILKSYKNDFSNHPPKEIVKRMLLLWESIPGQLAKENKKFVYSAVKSGARAREYETAIQWLIDAGVIYKVTRVRSGEIPLSGFEDMDAFKLYTLDIGLHGAMAKLEASLIVDKNELFKQYKGALTEQFILQELQQLEEASIHYWSPDESIAEMDFVIQYNGSVTPIEVKAEQHLKAKSIPVYISQNHPTCVIRTSLAPYHKGDTIEDIPLYACLCSIK